MNLTQIIKPEEITNGNTLNNVVLAVTQLGDRKLTKTGKGYLNIQANYQVPNNDNPDNPNFQSASIKIWSSDNLPNDFQAGFLVMVKQIKFDTFHDQLQWITDGSDYQMIYPNNQLKLKYGDFVEHSYWSHEQLHQGIQHYIDRISNPLYQQIIKQSYQTIIDQGIDLYEMPAAISMHHAFASGLMTHTLSMLKIADGILTNTIYHQLCDQNLVFTGILLHDLGKALCYTNAYSHVETTSGTLFDHIIIVDGLMTNIAEKITGKSYLDLLQDQDFDKLRQVVIAHHGKLEWGAPMQPELPEGWLVHYVDLLDSHMETVRESMMHEPTNDEGFTGKIYGLDNSRLWTK